VKKGFTSAIEGIKESEELEFESEDISFSSTSRSD